MPISPKSIKKCVVMCLMSTRWETCNKINCCRLISQESYNLFFYLRHSKQKKLKMHVCIHTLIIQLHLRNNNVLFLSTLAADVELKRTGLTNDVICILHTLLRTLDTEIKKYAHTHQFIYPRQTPNTAALKIKTEITHPISNTKLNEYN